MVKNKNTYNNTAIVLGGGSNAYGHIRALYAAKISCICIVEKGLHDFIRGTRLCRTYMAPNPLTNSCEAIAFVIDIIDQQNNEPVLFFASDNWMSLIRDHYKLFLRKSIIPQSNWVEVEKIFNKKYLYALAQQHNIPYPKTYNYRSLNDLLEKIDNIPFPCVLKPDITVNFIESLPKVIRDNTFHRTQTFKDKMSLIAWIDLLTENNVDFSFIVQEYIPGETKVLYTLTSYSNKHGLLIAGSIGHKVKQFPPNAGRIISGRLQHNEDILRNGSRLLNAIEYHGLANTEFKFDYRDNTYKLMEVNARLGMWNSSALFSGINFPEIVYQDLFTDSVSTVCYNTNKDGVLWTNIILDLICSMYLNNKVNREVCNMNFLTWLKSIRGKKTYAIWNSKDPIPFFLHILNLLKNSCKSIRI